MESAYCDLPGRVQASSKMSLTTSLRNIRRAALPASLILCLVSMQCAAQEASTARENKGSDFTVLYRSCRDCHGRAGEGSADGTAPVIAGQHYPYLLQQLMEFRDGSRVDAAESLQMHFAATKSWTLKIDRAIRGLAEQLSRTNVRYVPVRADRERVHIADADLHHARERYANQCAVCHGQNAGGNRTKGVPWLAGQHFPYLFSQMKQLRAAHRTTAGLGMPSTAAAGTDQELAALADYLAGLPHP